MKLTKYEHSCVLIEDDSGKKIVIDPGAYSNLPANLTNVEALIITHAHADHLHLPNIRLINESNPSAQIFGTKEVATQLDNVIIPDVLQTYQVSDFRLSFYGDKHEMIRDGVQVIDNLGVIINDQVAYPGDSFAMTESHVDYLLAPFSAPWLRMKEATDFIANSKAKFIIPTHDILLSDVGVQIHSDHFDSVSKQTSKSFMPLSIGQTISL